MEMAGAARGAVSSLLGSLSSVLVDEVKQLWGVRRALQSIKDEMESMNSFLLDLEEVDRPSHQQKTWMRQVRDLAKSAERCVGLQQALILRESHRSKCFLGYLPPVQTLYARHNLAMEVRELNERIKGVNERRQRYGVQIPPKSADKLTTTTAPITRAASLSQAAGKGDTGEEDDDDELRARRDSDDRRALAFVEPRILEECTKKLVNWLSMYTEGMAKLLNKDRLPSIAIAAPDEEDGADVAREALAHPSVAAKFEHKLWITFPWYRSPGPLDILEEILRELLPEAREDERAKTEELDRKIEEIVKKTKEHLPAAGTKRSRRVVPLEPLDILCDILQELLSAPVQSMGKDQIEENINETAIKIKEHLELDKTRSWIGLDHSDYVGILRELLPRPKEDKTVKEATDKLGDDQIAKNIREITNKIKVDILRELLPKPQEDNSVKEDVDRSGEDHIEEKIKETTEKIIVNMLRAMIPKPKADMDKLDEDQRIEDITEKIKRILENIKEHLLVKEIIKKIKEHLEGKRTMIVLDGIDYIERWEVTKWALSKLGCAVGSAAIVTTNYHRGASQYCNPAHIPIEYSLVGFYHYKAIRLTSPFVNEDYYDATILHAILKKCEPHELCMKLFVRALYANPNRSNEELDKLRDTLVFGGQLETNARKMIKFSYNDLPGDYKACFLYLAMFPQGHKIKRSTLVGHWIAEDLIAKEDRTHSVHRAERCFDELVDRWLVYPGDISAAGKVKSCMVHDRVHEFITKIARKEHFVEIRLSHHLALSDSIEKFLQNLYIIPQLPLVKVLDLEGCRYFKKPLQHYLKNICNKMLLLKYLSLRNTDITKLPKEINNLHQLEVLDIRQTKVRAHATKYILLLKLKRLLAGPIDLIPISTDTGTVRTEESFSSVQIPGGIEKMTNMEVLSHVKASPAGHELKYIGKLWQLRKLGVVIEDKHDHLGNLLRAISDLNECLQSLSITLPRSEGTPSSIDLPSEIRDRLRRPPKLLESLSISGITHSGQLLPLLANGRGKLTKLTLSCTHLNQDHLKDLGQLPSLRSIRLRHESYIKSNLTFRKDEFQNLKYFLVEGSNMIEISFENGAAPKLEKIVLSFTDMNSISFEDGAAPELEKMVLCFTNIESLRGVDILPELKEVELNGNRSPLSLFDNANRIAKVTLRDTLLKQGDIQILAKKPNVRCLMLLDKSCEESQLTFNNDEFPKLSLLVVECAGITNISFSDGAAPKLEKIAWSFTSMESLSGIDNLPRLKEFEFNGENVPDQVRQAIEAHPNDPYFKHNKPQNEDQGTGSAVEDEDAACFPFFWKNKDQC